MRCPRKLYLLVSRTLQDLDWQGDEMHPSKRRQQEIANYRNANEMYGVTDWRVETYTKA